MAERFDWEQWFGDIRQLGLMWRMSEHARRVVEVLAHGADDDRVCTRRLSEVAWGAALDQEHVLQAIHELGRLGLVETLPLEGCWEFWLVPLGDDGPDGPDGGDDGPGGPDGPGGIPVSLVA